MSWDFVAKPRSACEEIKISTRLWDNYNVRFTG